MVDLHSDRKTIGNKQVIKIKQKVDRSIENYKTRLVAKGYIQQKGINYEKTFSLVVRFTLICFILAIVVVRKMGLI